MLAAKLLRSASFVEPMPTIRTDGIDAATVEAMSEDEAFQEVCRRRWKDAPTCPKCGAEAPYFLSSRRTFKCSMQTCQHQFSPTSGTMLASRKLSYRDMLLAIAYAGPQLHSGIANQRTILDIRRRVAARR